MHCPRCGQQQVTEEIKFCSKCGFPLGLVSEILSHGGFLPQLADVYSKKTFWTRRNGLIIGGLWMFVMVLIITPLIGIAGGGDLAGVSAILGIFGGALIMLISAFFLLPADRVLFREQQNESSVNQLKQPSAQYALPPEQSIPANTYVPPVAGSWRDTNDLKQSASVVEDTTRLLDKELE